MREILFRGKIIELCQYHGQWLEGFYGVDDGKPFIAIPKENGLNGFYCDPETVGQYTGLSDKNGRNIFDGDVVRVYYPFDDPEDCVVSWSKEGARWDFGGCDAYFCKPSKNCEIIGNIFDNPELLEGKK